MIKNKNRQIDYFLFEKYDKNYFEKNLIVPRFEDDICLYLLVCKESNLLDIYEKFDKVLKFEQIEKNRLLFILSYLPKKIEAYSFAKKLEKSNNENEKNIEKLVFLILQFSIDLRASDIHFEKYENSLFVRFRIDGRLKTFFSFDIIIFKSLSSYFKLISNLDITQYRLPLNSRFSYEIYDKKYDFRISTMPTLESESIVIRILDNKNVNKSLDTLGLSLHLYEEIKKALCLTQGLILITGPTGSGKTTTLYSMLKELKSDEKKIITVEDPIEYKIDSISQVQVNSKIGLDFQLVLKNILRQDPDIIFIGEIRDKFSLDIALQASLTGHLVLASIHANNSVETISRLIDLQADEFLISSTLKLIISQRLVLKYCKNCNQKGCEKCNYTSFFDRTNIAEVLKIDENISSMIFKKDSISNIKNYLKSIKFKTMLDDGKQKVLEKQTSIEEVYKAISL